jgi:poly-gamma-glutamate biosynthesis protein PgsC/CapC
VHSYLFDVETVRVAVVVGVIISALFYEHVQLTTGGAIVPGYLALFLPTPLFIVFTLAAAYLTFYIVNRVLARRYILYGRRKFEVEILTGLVIIAVSTAIAHFVVRFHPLLLALYGIGFVIPGILAHDMFRQTPWKTVVAVLANVAIVGLIVYIFYSLLRIAPWYAPAEVPAFAGQDLGYPLDMLLLAVITSVLVGMLVFSKLGLRTGGFVSGAYLALVMLRPLDLLFAAGVAVVTYVFVTGFLMKQLILFGRRKLGMMVLTAAVFAWAGEIAIRNLTGGAYIPWSGFHVITLMIPALLANDSQRQGIYRTLWGTAITAVAVFAVMNLADAARVYFAA